ncbi:hypothetical protein RchiOBHm_Chr7g0228731 [Rosa chinensis]|uniref:Uncharacterized protein n=1 Tax=Rosa chinensis TaxID=74649 RepID=A0A2P6PEY4_ROSCH|nr:hypothetical protein RchiOBHm_Chr7g0228731 [Rosa chinensis]
MLLRLELPFKKYLILGLYVVPSRSRSTSRNRELLEKKIKPAKGNSWRQRQSYMSGVFKTNHPEFGVLLEDGFVGQQGIQAGPLMPSLDKYRPPGNSSRSFDDCVFTSGDEC